LKRTQPLGTLSAQVTCGFRLPGSQESANPRASETGIPVYRADNPLESVVLGTGKCVEDFDALQQVLIPDRRR